MSHNMFNTNKTVYIKTFGCSLNQSDSEVMAGLLKEAGYEVITDEVVTEYGVETKDVAVDVLNDDVNDAGNPKSVDVVIINSCTVKNLAESKFFKELRKWKSKNVKVIVAGCIAQAEPKLLNKELKDVSVIGTRKIVNVVEIVNAALQSKIIHNIENNMNERLNLPKSRRTGIIEILPISEGCLSKCAFCKTKFARGELLSYPKEKIVEQFKSALNDGCKEFWITSQDCGCYGFDTYSKEKYFLPQLLDDLLSINGDFRIRLGMSNPDHVDRIKDDLVQTFKHPKMFKFLHIPVQSGNDKVLRDMKRPYTIKDFYNILDLFRKEIPGVCISTDLIAGFPQETDEEFEDTLKLVRAVRFDVLNFSRFWLRKGTDAEKLKQVQAGIIKSRTEKIKQLFNSMIEQQNKSWLHNECTILIDEYGKNGVLIGRDDYYKQIIIKPSLDTLKLGDFARVRIIQTKRYVLVSELI